MDNVTDGYNHDMPADIVSKAQRQSFGQRGGDEYFRI